MGEGRGAHVSASIARGPDHFEVRARVEVVVRCVAAVSVPSERPLGDPARKALLASARENSDVFGAVLGRGVATVGDAVVAELGSTDHRAG